MTDRLSNSEKFNGFAPESLVSLRDLKENNNKAWFEAHRSDYEQHLLSPLRALTAGLTPLMLSIDANFVTAPARTISRIYRDTRFSRDKSPYKTTLLEPLYHFFSRLRIAGKPGL